MRLCAASLTFLIALTGLPSAPMATRAMAQVQAPIDGAFALPRGTKRRSGNVVFVLPAGWEAIEQSIGSDDLPSTSVRVEDWLDRDAPMVEIPRGAVFAGTDAELGRWGESMLTRYLDLDESETFAPLGWTPSSAGAVRLLTGGGTVRRRDDGQPEKAVIATVFSAGGRADLAFVEVSLGDPDTLQARMRAASGALVGAIGTFSFISAGAPPLLPVPTPGPYEGLWRGQYIVTSLGMDMMMQTRLALSSYVFSRDGTFARGIPDGGIGVLSDPELAMVRTGDTGNYLVEGKRVRLLYADGDADELEVNDDGSLQDGQATLYRTDVPADGFTFDGTSSSFSYTGMPSFGGPIGGSGVASSSATTFHRDGTFSQERSTAVNGNTPDVSYAFNNANTSDGTYRIQGGELVMQHDARPGEPARVRRGELVVLEGDGGPSLWWGTEEIELAPGQTIPKAGPPVPAKVPRPSAPISTASAAFSAPGANPLAPPANPLAAPVNPLASPTPANPLALATRTPVNPLSR